MKTVCHVVVVAIAFLASAAAHAANPREELKQLTAQLQSNPSDTALREKIIKLAQTIKPAPTVPEEAERRMVRGAAAFKGAKSESDFKDAAREFEQASLVAPWSGDIYYNLGLAQDKAGDHAAAVRSLKLALLASPTSKETKNLLYEVEYRAEKANSPETQAAKKREQEEAVLRTLDGAMFRKEFTLPTDRGGTIVTQVFTVSISGRQVTYSTWLPINPAAGTTTYTCELNGPSCDLKTGNTRFRQTLSFSSDGRTVKSVEYFDGALSRDLTMTRQN